jgi:hypothetical protein
MPHSNPFTSQSGYETPTYTSTSTFLRFSLWRKIRNIMQEKNVYVYVHINVEVNSYLCVCFPRRSAIASLKSEVFETPFF